MALSTPALVSALLLLLPFFPFSALAAPPRLPVAHDDNMKDHIQGNKFLLNNASDDLLAYPSLYPPFVPSPLPPRFRSPNCIVGLPRSLPFFSPLPFLRSPFDGLFVQERGSFGELALSPAGRVAMADGGQLQHLRHSPCH